jgi:hypothetical protein
MIQCFTSAVAGQSNKITFRTASTTASTFATIQAHDNNGAPYPKAASRRDNFRDNE